MEFFKVATITFVRYEVDNGQAFPRSLVPKARPRSSLQMNSLMVYGPGYETAMRWLTRDCWSIEHGSVRGRWFRHMRWVRGEAHPSAPNTIHLRQTHPKKRQIVAFTSISTALTHGTPAAKRPGDRSRQQQVKTTNRTGAVLSDFSDMRMPVPLS